MMCQPAHHHQFNFGCLIDGWESRVVTQVQRREDVKGVSESVITSQNE